MAVVIVVSDDSNRDGMQSTNRNVTRSKYLRYCRWCLMRSSGIELLMPPSRGMMQSRERCQRDFCVVSVHRGDCDVFSPVRIHSKSNEADNSEHIYHLDIYVAVCFLFFNAKHLALRAQPLRFAKRKEIDFLYSVFLSSPSDENQEE